MEKKDVVERRCRTALSKEVVIVLLIAWLVLLIIAWPVAILVLLAYPVIWVLSIPFRLIGITVSGALDLVEAIVRLPARIVRLGT